MFSRFHLIPERYGRTDGRTDRQTDRFAISISRVSMLTCDKKSSGNFGYMGRSNPWGDLDQMWRVERYGGRNHVCNICDCRLKGVGVVRGVSLPSPIDLTCRPYNTGHTTV